MYGWRARIGLIVPCVNTTTEYEFNYIALKLPGVSIHTARMHLDLGHGLTHNSLLNMHDIASENAITELAHAKPDLIVYACTSGSFVGGIEWDHMITKNIEELTGIQCITTSTAVVSALNMLGVKKIAVGTPYDEAVTLTGLKFLEDSGFSVVSHLALDKIHEIVSGVRLELGYELGKKVNTNDAECVFLSCTQFPTLRIIKALEEDLNKPVISSNIASLWKAFQMCSIQPEKLKFCRLFNCF